MIKQLMSVVIAAGLIAGCRHQAEPAAESKIKPLPAQSLIRQWTADIPLSAGDQLTDIYVRDNAVVAYTKKHTTIAINRESGQLYDIAEFDPSGQVMRAPAVLADRIIYPTGTTLEIFNYRGNKLRSMLMPWTIRSGVSGLSQRVYMGADGPNGGRVLAVDTDKTYDYVNWELMTTGGSVVSTPAVHQGIVYAASENGHVYAVNDNREPVWPIEGNTFVTSGPITADLVVDDFGLYVASGDSKMYCLNRGTGIIKWQYFGGKPLKATPAVTTDMVYILVPEQGLVAIDKTTGDYNRKPKWTNAGATQFLAEDEKFAYLRRGDNTIIAVDKKTGEESFRSKRSDFALFGTNTKDAVIFAATASGQIMAIKPVLKPGAVGEIVLDVRPLDQSLATAN